MCVRAFCAKKCLTMVLELGSSCNVAVSATHSALSEDLYSALLVVVDETPPSKSDRGLDDARCFHSEPDAGSTLHALLTRKIHTHKERERI